MHAIILAGGKGLRLRELTHSSPKGLLSIGSYAMIDHIIYHLAMHGLESVTIAAGYRCEDYQAYFAQVDGAVLPVQVIDTGHEVDTGGRLQRLAKTVFAKLDNSEPVFLCWSDGLSDLDVSAMIAQHKASSHLVTLAAVHPPARFGDLQIEDDLVLSFAEKQKQTDRWINGGYFVIEPSVLSYINGDNSSWERDVLSTLSTQGKLGAYRHNGDWACMDTLHEHAELNRMVNSGKAFWPTPKN